MSSGLPPTPAGSGQTGPSAGARIRDGILLIFRALWFVISFLLYALGLALYYAGKALIQFAGWNLPGAGGGRQAGSSRMKR